MGLRPGASALAAALIAALIAAFPAAAQTPAAGDAQGASLSGDASKAAAQRPGTRRSVKPRRLPARARKNARRASRRLLRALPRGFGAGPRPGSASRAFSTTYGWSSGSNVWDYGYECWDILGGNPTPYERMVSSWTSYYRSTDDLSYPRVGDRFWVSIYLGITGLPCGGLIDIAPHIAAPMGNTNFAIDTQNPVRCWAKPPGKAWGEVSKGTWTVNLTNGPVSGTWCHDPANGLHGSLMGTAMLGQGWEYEVIFPVYVTSPMSGCPNHRLIGNLSSSNIYKFNGVGYYPAVSDPMVCLFAPGTAIDPNAPVQGGGTTPGTATRVPAPEPEQPPPAEQDTAAPTLTSSAASSLKMATAFRGLNVGFECSEACTAETQVTIPGSVAKRLKLSAARPPVVVASGRTTLANAGKGTIKAVFKAKAKRKLRKLKRVKLTVTTFATDLAGNRSAPAVRAVTLKRR